MGEASTLALRSRAVLLTVALALVLAPARALDSSTSSAPAPPQRLFPGLFAAVQTQELYPDSKTFADVTPRFAPEAILDRFRQTPPATPEALRRFVDENFSVPVDGPLPETAPAATAESLDHHIDRLWNQLTRRSETVADYSSLLPLPYPYVVPGGRFRELYYWDSYFTMLGLADSGRADLVQAMVSNFAFLIDRYGHVPNGTRSYYLSRSQPPLFFAMVGLLSPNDPPAAYARFLTQLRREHAFWMDGAQSLEPGHAHRRVVALAGGVILNRNWDDEDTPRDESFREDRALAVRSGREPAALYRDLRAAAESGWDFSSRWLADGQRLETIHTTELLPIDLNSLLYGLESAIAEGCVRVQDRACVREFRSRGRARQRGMNRYLWDVRSGSFRDYNWMQRAQVPRLSAATLYPLFVGVASRAQARSVAATVKRELLDQGGVVTTRERTGQQWDAPNGWAPLQWIAVSGLRRYGRDELARGIATRWLETVERVYRSTGRLMEKYDLTDPERPGGGGEYPLQDGFGWTNGVTRRLMTLYPEQVQPRRT